jgi:hypothetical protein
MLRCQSGDDAVVAVQLSFHAGDDAASAKAAGGCVKRGVEFVQESTDFVAQLGSLPHQVTPIVLEQLHLPRRSVQRCDRKIRMSQRRQRNRLRIDRIGLASLPSRPPGISDQPGRYSNDPLPSRQQVTLEASGQVTAVLQRELDLLELPGPPQQLQMPLAVGRHRLLANLPADPSNATTV